MRERRRGPSLAGSLSELRTARMANEARNADYDRLSITSVSRLSARRLFGTARAIHTSQQGGSIPLRVRGPSFRMSRDLCII
jgi:hypothetical protein